MGGSILTVVFQAPREEIKSPYTVNGTFCTLTALPEELQMICKLTVHRMKEQTSALNCVEGFYHLILEVYQTTPNLLLC